MHVTLGDSVMWGQGLLEVHKFDMLVAAGAEVNRQAHSGAVLGSEGDSSTQKEYPEIPVSYPSVWQQVAAVEDWTDVDLVLVNGGINDVSLGRILSPWVSAAQIAQLTQQFCQQEMARLLPKVAAQLVKPGARVVVVGYYPILSPATRFDDMKQAQKLMEMHGVATSSMDQPVDVEGLIPSLVNNCMTFWKTSNDALQAAVDMTNAGLGRAVCVFVPTPLTEANALWAPQSELWQLNRLLDAEDEVKPYRDRACSDLYGDVVHLFPWIKCDRASVGHPKVSGAAAIAGAIEAALAG